MPSPSQYNHGSDFDKAKPNMPAYSFGISRNAYDKVALPNMKSQQNPDKTIPGPGLY